MVKKQAVILHFFEAQNCEFDQQSPLKQSVHQYPICSPSRLQRKLESVNQRTREKLRKIFAFDSTVNSVSEARICENKTKLKLCDFRKLYLCKFTLIKSDEVLLMLLLLMFSTNAKVQSLTGSK